MFLLHCLVWALTTESLDQEWLELGAANTESYRLITFQLASQRIRCCRRCCRCWARLGIVGLGIVGGAIAGIAGVVGAAWTAFVLASAEEIQVAEEAWEWISVGEEEGTISGHIPRSIPTFRRIPGCCSWRPAT